MATTQGGHLLAEMQGETARAWQDFADANHVSLESLLNALGPILSQAGHRNLGLRDVLNEAIAGAN